MMKLQVCCLDLGTFYAKEDLILKIGECYDVRNLIPHKPDPNLRLKDLQGSRILFHSGDSWYRYGSDFDNFAA